MKKRSPEEHRYRNEQNSFLRFVFSNGVSVTSLIVIIYYAGIITEKNDAQLTTMVQVKSSVESTRETVQNIRTEIAVLKSRMDALEKSQQLREWAMDKKGRP